MTDNVKIMAILSAKPGKAEELHALLFSMAPLCRAEPANLHFEIWQDQSNPATFALDELYEDAAGVVAHKETAHYKNYFAKINDLADRTAVVLQAADLGR